MATEPIHLKRFVLLAPDGSVVGHADTIGAASTLADDVAFALDEIITVAEMGSIHTPKELPDVPKKSPEAEAQTAERARAAVVAKAAAKAVSKVE